jgi:hypothetical protein
MPASKAYQQQNRSEPNRNHHVHLRLINGGGQGIDSRGELRCSRRVPLECYIKAKSSDSGEVFYAMSKNLSVDGIALVAQYVPRYGERLEIQLQSPKGSTLKPFKALVQVRRCVQLEDQKGYEIGAAILKVRE